MPWASRPAIVAALIMPCRTACAAAPRSRSVVTSAALPGQRKEAIGRSRPSSTMPSTTWCSRADWHQRLCIADAEALTLK
jgi:hypothetical protein